MKGFLDTVDKVHPAVNIAMLAGHGDFRRALAGDSGRPLTAEEKGQMKSFAAKALTDGAFGISSGLEYVPGRFADVDELASVSAGIVAFGGIHASHIRNEGPMLLESIDELVAVAKQSGARIEISHLKSCGPDNWGKVAKVLEVFDTENVKGIDISSDFYPYLASSTGLSIVLPDWVLEQGRQAAIEILLPYKRIFESGQKSLADLESDTAKKACTESNARTLVQGGWDKIVITSIKNPEDKWMEGLNVEEVSLKLELPAAETAMGILARNNIDVGIARHAMSEDDLISVMKHPRSCVVTDGSVSIPSKGKIHPRSIGTYPRLFGRYVKELGVLSVEEAVRKCTSLPASKIGLKDRGILSEDKMADIIIFDPDTIAEKSTYQDPWQYPVGIFALFVNGSPVIWEGNVTGKRPGKALRRS